VLIVDFVALIPRLAARFRQTLRVCGLQVRWNGSAEGRLELRVAETAGGTAALRLVVVGRLDRETEPRYTASVTAVDAGTPPRSARLDVTVSQRTPRRLSTLLNTQCYCFPRHPQVYSI